jgi:tRNA-modifying protein YgfZ
MRSILELVSTAETTDTDSLSADYRALSEGCGLIDRSERGKLALRGTGAVEFLNGQVTNELDSLHPGEGCYAAFLTHKGKMLGDLRILAVGETQTGAPSELLLDTERVALQGLFDMIRRFKVGYEVELEKRTLQSGLLSLVGPHAQAVAERAVDDEAVGPAGATRTPGASEHDHRPASIAGCAVRLIRTAEPAGLDVLCEAGDAATVQAALIEAGARPVSEEAGEILRVEHGRPRYGVDLDDTVIPQEAGLNERAVSFTKGCYVGQETVARLHYRGRPNRHLRGLRAPVPLACGEELRLGERVLGRVASVAVSPRFGPIALALVRREAEPGAIVSVGEHGAGAEVGELPFAP